MEPDINKALSNAKDRLYLRAIIRYLKELMIDIIEGLRDVSKNRYLITYPSDWTSEQVAYLRSLAQMAGFVDAHDHQDRLMLFSEGASILRMLQEPYMNENIKQGRRYLICDMGGSKIKSSLHHIKEALNTANNIKGEIYCDWDVNYMKEPSRLPLGMQDIERSCEAYLLSRLFPSSTTTDFLDQKELTDLDRFVRSVLKKSVQDLCTKAIEKNEPSIYQIPISLQLKQQRLDSPNLDRANSMESQYQHSKVFVEEKDIQSEDRCMLIVSPVEVVKNVIKPVYERVTQYFQNVLRGAGDSIEAVILVGGFCNCVYLVELIQDTCKREGTKVVSFHAMRNPSLRKLYSISQGALVKSMDKISVDIRRPRVVLDEEFSLHIESKVPEVFVFIEYGDNVSRASYIYHQQEQPSSDENIKHMVGWVGQSVLAWDFPTIEVMLIPGKGKQGIIMYTYSRDVAGESTHAPDKANREQSDFGACVNGTEHFSETLVEAPLHPRVQTCNTHSNINGCEFTVTQKVITVQEFSTMYFKYLNTLLNDHIHLETDARNYRFRFCITYDVDIDGFRLTDEDIYLIANNVGMISKDLHPNDNTLLILRREEATAIHCRELLNGFDLNDQVTYSNFVQVQLTETQCVILLNSFPILGDNNNIKNTLHEEDWKGIHKQVKSKKVTINVMDITCENLWTYFQSQDHNSIKNCERHQSLHHFYNTKNMQIFKKLLLNYFSTFGISPAIDQLASIIQGGILNLCLYQEVHVNNIFVMGAFLFCRHWGDYAVLEELLLMKLRSIKLQPLYNSMVRNLTKNISVTKVDVQKKEVEKYGHSDKYKQDTLSRVALKGSIIYASDPRNRLLERFASKTYAVYIGVKTLAGRTINDAFEYGNEFYDGDEIVDGIEDAVYVTCEQSKSSFEVTTDTPVNIIEKGTPLMSMALDGEEISTYFTMHECVKDVQIYISKCIVLPTK
ncbi:unnamed protein product [Mucor hiemalis]